MLWRVLRWWRLRGRKLEKYKTNWRLYLVFIIGGLIGTVAIMPFDIALTPLPANINMPLALFASIMQTMILVALASYFGIRLAKRMGFKMPILEKIANGEKFGSDLKSIWKSSVLWGLLGGVIVVILCIPFWNMSIDLMRQEMAAPWWSAVLAPLYGGFVEELFFRLFLMTFIIWIASRFTKGKPTKVGIWIAIIISAVIFGLGHLGITSNMTAITAAVVIRAVLLNGTLSIIYGLFYWKKGLETAMIAHASTDVVLHILIPQIIARMFF